VPLDASHINFAHRALPSELRECMDEPCSYEDFRDCLVDLASANRLTLGYRTTLRWIDQYTQKLKPERPLHIVDVGSGGGDMLRRIDAWAARRKIAVKLTGIDLNPHAARAAREFSPDGCEIEWITGDVFSYAPAEGVDIVISSLFTHHLETEEIVHFLKWMESVTRYGWFVNDLYRSRTAYELFGALAEIAGWHRFVRHDGPVSIRRSFREEDWRRLCAGAGLEFLPLEALSFTRRFPYRLCVERLK
jgi:SAM-dependent methyltransferase